MAQPDSQASFLPPGVHGFGLGMTAGHGQGGGNGGAGVPPGGGGLHMNGMGGGPDGGMAGVDELRRRQWMMQQAQQQQQQQAASGAFGNQQQMAELMRNNAQFQQGLQQHHNPHLQQQLQQMSQLNGHQQQQHPQQPQQPQQQNGQPNIAIPQTPQQQAQQQQQAAAAQLNQQHHNQQMEQLIRNPPQNPNPFDLQQRARRMAISSGDMGRQLQLLNQGNGIQGHPNVIAQQQARANSIVQTQGQGQGQPGHSPQPPHSQFTHPQLQNPNVAATAMNLANQHPIWNGAGQPGGPGPGQQNGMQAPQGAGQGHNPFGQSQGGPSRPGQTPTPQAGPGQPPATYQACVQQIQALQRAVQQSEQELQIMINTRPQQVEMIPMLHADINRKKHLMSQLTQFARSAPFPDRPANPQQPPQNRSTGPSPAPNNQTGRPWSGSPRLDFPGAPVPVNNNHPVNNQELHQQLSRLQQMSPLARQTDAMRNMINSRQGNPSGALPPHQLQHGGIGGQQAPAQGSHQQGAPRPSPQPGHVGIGQGAGPGSAAGPSQGGQPNQQQQQLTPQQQAMQAQQRRAMSELAIRIQHGYRPPALEKSRFDITFRTYLEKNNKPMQLADQNVTIEGVTFGLWDLHREVMALGSFVIVNSQNLWSLVGVQLGYPTIPGSNPPRTSDHVGDMLRGLHHRYLMQFDIAYLGMILKNGLGAGNNGQQSASAEQPQNLPGGPSIEGALNVSGGQQMNPTQSDLAQQHQNQPSPGHPPQPGLSQGTQQQQQQQQQNMQMHLGPLLMYADMTVDEMRQRGLNEDVITSVERARPVLQRQLQMKQYGMLNSSANGQMNGNGRPGQGQGPGQQIPQQQGNPPPSNMSIPGRLTPQPPHQPSNATGVQHASPYMNQMDQMNRAVPPPGSMFTGHLGMNSQSQQFTRPSTEQITKGQEFVGMMKLQMEKQYANGPLQQGIVLDDEVQEWRSMFDLAVKQISEVRKAQVPFMVIFNDVTLVKRLVFYEIVIVKQHERLQQPGSPNFLINLETLKTIINLFKNSLLRLREVMASISKAPNEGMTRQGPPMLQPPHGDQPDGQSKYVQPVQTEIPRAPSTRIPTPHNQPAISKTGRAANGSALGKPPGAANTPSPSSAATPAATPNNAGSPKTPKSPGKKIGKRPPNTKQRKKESVGKSPAAGPSAPSPQGTAPTPSESGSLKRARPEEPTPTESRPQPPPPEESVVANTPPPFKKPRLSSEWEAPVPVPVGQAAPLEATSPPPLKIEEEDSEKVIADLEQLLANAGDAFPPELSETFGALANELALGFPEASTSSTAQSNPVKMEPPTVPPDVFEFIDFSQLDDSDPAAANTPELIAPASTGPSNCSPESAPDVEVAHAARAAIAEKQKSITSAVDLKTEPVAYDPAAAILGELDGGIGLNFQFDDWKWEGSMAVADWAISTS